MEIKRCYPVLVGASVVENQLCNGESVTVPNGHKFYLKKSGTESLGASTGTAITGLTSGTDMVIDLTRLLGSAIADYAYTIEQQTAGSGIAWLRSYGFLKGYQAYNAGSIESVEVTEKVIRGFNQWDEEWKVIGDHIESKNPIPCLPNTAYYMQSPYNPSNGLFFWTRDMVRTGTTRYNRGLFTTPSDCYYMTFKMTNAYGTTYNHDICISLSSDRNGEYEPYKSTSYPLGSDVLRGLFKLDANNNLYADGDRKTADGTITRRYGVVDLGTLDWDNGSTNTSGVYRKVASVSGIKIVSAATEVGNIICNKYETVTALQTFRVEAAGICVNNMASQVIVYDPNYSRPSDVASFKTAMSGVMLVYELATPTTEQSTPFTSPQIVYPDGTEEFITENGVPVGHETKYQL